MYFKVKAPLSIRDANVKSMKKIGIALPLERRTWYIQLNEEKEKFWHGVLGSRPILFLLLIHLVSVL